MIDYKQEVISKFPTANCGHFGGVFEVLYKNSQGELCSTISFHSEESAWRHTYNKEFPNANKT